MLLGQLQRPEEAADFVACWKPESPNYKAFNDANCYSRYRNPILDGDTQYRLESLAAHIAEHFAHFMRRYPGMDHPAVHDGLNGEAPPMVIAAVWEDLQQVFQAQEFTSPERCQQEAAAVAYRDMPPAHYPQPNDPAEFSKHYFREALTEWLTSGRRSDEESFDKVNALNDAAKAADLWKELPAERRQLAYMPLIELLQLNGSACRNICRCS